MRVFSEIQKVKPTDLYIFSDFPEKEKDITLSKQSKRIVSDINWKCNLRVNFSKKHLGCKHSVSNGIDWFFSNVDRGIILEDDCLPNQSFFYFCDNLLKKYSNNKKIMSISGTNYVPEHISKNNSDYFFSYYGGVWGWATWKRAWNKYDLNMKSWNQDSSKKQVKKVLDDPIQFLHRKYLFDKSYYNKIDTWDYAWSYARLINKGLTIIPKKSLIKNIGFGANATHTKGVKNAFDKIKRNKISNKLIHPSIIEADINYDNKFFYKLLIEGFAYSLFNIPIIILNKIREHLL